MSVRVQVVEEVTQCIPSNVVGTVAGKLIVLFAVAAVPKVVVKFPLAGKSDNVPAVPDLPSVGV